MKINFKKYCIRKKCKYLIKKKVVINKKTFIIPYCFFCKRYCGEQLKKESCFYFTKIEFYL